MHIACLPFVPVKELYGITCATTLFQIHLLLVTLGHSKSSPKSYILILLSIQLCYLFLHSHATTQSALSSPGNRICKQPFSLEKILHCHSCPPSCIFRINQLFKRGLPLDTVNTQAFPLLCLLELGVNYPLFVVIGFEIPHSRLPFINYMWNHFSAEKNPMDRLTHDIQNWLSSAGDHSRGVVHVSMGSIAC